MRQQFPAQTFIQGLTSAEKEYNVPPLLLSRIPLALPPGGKDVTLWPWEEPAARCWRVRWVSAVLPAQSLAFLPHTAGP